MTRLAGRAAHLPGEEAAIFAQADELNAHIARFLEHYG